MLVCHEKNMVSLVLNISFVSQAGKIASLFNWYVS